MTRMWRVALSKAKGASHSDLKLTGLSLSMGSGGYRSRTLLRAQYPPGPYLRPPVSVSVSNLISKSDPPHLIRSAALEMLDKNHKHRLQIFTDLH